MNTSVSVGFLTLLRERLAQVPYIALGGVTLAVLLALMTPRLMRLSHKTWPLDDGERHSMIISLRYLYLTGLTEIFARTLTTSALVLVALCVGMRVEPALLSGFGPVIEQPRWLILIEMLVLSDFIYYWTHRMAHTVPALWKLHAIHHATEHMSFAAAARVHPLETYALVLNMLPLFALGFPVDALVPLAPLTMGYALLIHSNVRFNPRRFVYFVNSPAYHHWHHSKKFRAKGTNFAGHFPIFDVLFGSYYFPKHAPEEVGVDDPNMPRSYCGQLLYPFQRRHECADEVQLQGSNQAAQ